jgi:hypothetical protein
MSIFQLLHSQTSVRYLRIILSNIWDASSQTLYHLLHQHAPHTRFPWVFVINHVHYIPSFLVATQWEQSKGHWRLRAFLYCCHTAKLTQNSNLHYFAFYFYKICSLEDSKIRIVSFAVFPEWQACVKLNKKWKIDCKAFETGELNMVKFGSEMILFQKLENFKAIKCSWLTEIANFDKTLLWLADATMFVFPDSSVSNFVWKSNLSERLSL